MTDCTDENNNKFLSRISRRGIFQYRASWKRNNLIAIRCSIVVHLNLSNIFYDRFHSYNNNYFYQECLEEESSSIENHGEERT